LSLPLEFSSFPITVPVDRQKFFVPIARLSAPVMGEARDNVWLHSPLSLAAFRSHDNEPLSGSAASCFSVFWIQAKLSPAAPRIRLRVRFYGVSSLKFDFLMPDDKFSFSLFL